MTHHQQTGFGTARAAAAVRPARRRARHPAAVGRVLAAGVSASAAIALGGLMFHEARVAVRSQHPAEAPQLQVDPGAPALQVDPRASQLQVDPGAPPTVAVPKPVVAPTPPPEVPTITETRASR